MLLRNILIGVLITASYLVFHFTATESELSVFSLFNSTSTEKIEADGKNAIQVALLLDTSGSMSGLIEQAKSQLWNILNELARTEKKGEETTLEIALYEYGNPDKAGDYRQINRLSCFTTDMDFISEKLFSLTTEGGDEYCGAIIETALEELEWKDGNGLKVIYIVGNESFTQGPVNYASACKKAQEQGVIVNAIFCGDYNSGIRDYWESGALAGGGAYLNINHNEETVYIPTPYDEKMNVLNAQLNETYIPFGQQGQAKKSNQLFQDQNASNYSLANVVDRAVFKCSKSYVATDWDLVDACKKDKSILKNQAILPESMQNFTVQELEAKIIAIDAQRTSIQKEMQELDKKRRQYKAEHSEDTEEGSLQYSMLKCIRVQAEAKGFELSE